jgi:Porin subfamily
MKMVKSLLLGSAAGLAAVAGAQAADLPVKAKAVEYVKVCSLYGAGFYYIPGTDTCLKIGGYVRTEWNHNAAGSFNTNVAGADAFYTRASNTLVNRTRALFSFDVRSQTEYGTLRSYVRAGWQWTTNTDTTGGSASAVYLDRAFIQFAGFTFGKTQSFFDVPDIADMTYQTEYSRNNTGGSGTPVFAYTAMFGNGVTGTISLEDYTERKAAIVSVGVGTTHTIGTGETARNHGNEVPDIVGNLRVDQAWGSAQVSGALHLNQAQYYINAPGLVNIGHPDDKWGWAVGAGLLLKMPWSPLDTFAVAATYAEGATTYVWNVPGSFNARSNGANLFQDGGVSAGWLNDAYYCDSQVNPTCGGNLELPKAWNIQAGFQHYWTNSLRSSIWGSYSSYEANSNAVDTRVCALRGFGAGCADFKAWQVGSRTIWNPVTNLDIGLEVMYTKIETAFSGGTTNCGGAGCVPMANPAGIPSVVAVQDNDVWSGVLRIQRNFWP